MLLIPACPSRLTGALMLGFVLSIGAASVVRSDEAPRTDVDELVRVNSRNLDHLFVAPDADFSGYRHIMLDPVDVSFSDRWNPNSRSHTHRRLSDQDIETIRSNVATEFEKSIEAELSKSGYTRVDHAGDDVLQITPSIVNLYITAPSQQQSAGRSRTYVANTGHMTLVADLRDSVTGEHLARAIDTQRGRSTGTLQLATSVSNMADARRAFTTWARVLRTGLDDAKESAITNEDVDRKQVATKDAEGAPR